MAPPLLITTALGTLVGTTAVLVWRFRETRRPLNERKIIAPPLAMSTGLAMFLLPDYRLPWSWAALAFALGMAIFAYPIIATTRLTVEADGIYMKRSKAFLFILFALAAVRLTLRSYLDHIITPQQSVGLAFILALGMILRWRLSVLRQYRRLALQTEAGQQLQPK